MINKGTVAAGVILGSAIGVGFGVLFAPEKGKKTRKYIKEEASEIIADIKKDARKIKEDLNNSVKNSKTKLNEDLDLIVNKASHKADDLIHSLEKVLKTLKDKNEKFRQTT